MAMAGRGYFFPLLWSDHAASLFIKLVIFVIFVIVIERLRIQLA
jgi:hypothetical protein